MHRRLAAEFAAEQFDGAVSDHLVQIQFDCLPEPVCQTTRGKWPSESAVDHLARRAGDGGSPAPVEQAELLVGLRRGQLDDAEGAHQRLRHALGADTEVLARALRLRAPVAVGGHVDRAERVGLDAQGCAGGGFRRAAMATVLLLKPFM